MRNRIPIGNIRQEKGRKMQELVKCCLEKARKMWQKLIRSTYIFLLWCVIKTVIVQPSEQEQKRPWVMLRVAEHLSQWVVAGAGWWWLGPSRCNYYKINMLPAAQIDHNYAPLFLLRLLIISFVLLFNSLPCNIFINGYMQSYLLSGENQLFWCPACSQL